MPICNSLPSFRGAHYLHLKCRRRGESCMKATAVLCMERANCIMGVASQLALVWTTLIMEPASSSKPPVN